MFSVPPSRVVDGLCGCPATSQADAPTTRMLAHSQLEREPEDLGPSSPSDCLLAHRFTFRKSSVTGIFMASHAMHMATTSSLPRNQSCCTSTNAKYSPTAIALPHSSQLTGRLRFVRGFVVRSPKRGYIRFPLLIVSTFHFGRGESNPPAQSLNRAMPTHPRAFVCLAFT